MHLAQVWIEDYFVSLADDDLGRSGSPLEVAGVNGVELDLRQPLANGSRLLFATLVEHNIKVPLKDTFSIRTRLAVPNQPERRCHWFPPVP
jgi:hypothetical protein